MMMSNGSAGSLTVSIHEGGGNMACCEPVTKGIQSIVSSVAAGILFMTMTACSSDQPKPMAQPTPDQVRNHADRGFDKLKQDEQERAAQPQVP
jgi:hypothetical protein